MKIMKIRVALLLIVSMILTSLVWLTPPETVYADDDFYVVSRSYDYDSYCVEAGRSYPMGYFLNVPGNEFDRFGLRISSNNSYVADISYDRKTLYARRSGTVTLTATYNGRSVTSYIRVFASNNFDQYRDATTRPIQQAASRLMSHYGEAITTYNCYDIQKDLRDFYKMTGNQNYDGSVAYDIDTGWNLRVERYILVPEACYIKDIAQALQNFGKLYGITSTTGANALRYKKVKVSSERKKVRIMLNRKITAEQIAGSAMSLGDSDFDFTNNDRTAVRVVLEIHDPQTLRFFYLIGMAEEGDKFIDFYVTEWDDKQNKYTRSELEAGHWYKQPVAVPFFMKKFKVKE